MAGAGYAPSNALKEVPQNGSTLLPLGRIRTQRIQNPHFRGRERIEKNCHPPVPLLTTDQNKPIEVKAVFFLWQALFPPKGNRADHSLEAEFPVEQQIHELHYNFNQIIPDPTITPQLFRYFTICQPNAQDSDPIYPRCRALGRRSGVVGINIIRVNGL